MTKWWTADELMINRWWTDDEQMMNRWWTDDELLMNSWWTADEQLINWWWTDDELMMNWWWTDDELMMNWWWTDDELMNWSGLPKTITDYHRLPLTDWLYSIEHSNLSPGSIHLYSILLLHISLTPPTTRAPLAVLKMWVRIFGNWQIMEFMAMNTVIKPKRPNLRWTYQLEQYTSLIWNCNSFSSQCRMHFNATYILYCFCKVNQS